MFKISDLLQYDDITIQCHNSPDADTIASAFAVRTYLCECGKSVKIVYSGNIEITKPNLLEMITRLNIPIEYVKPGQLPRLNTLLLVDCQYGEGNVEKFEADTVAVIDHHVQTTECAFGIIEQYGSCSTLVWLLLSRENFDFGKYSDVTTALYYGLFTDTGKFEEISHPLDRDMRDALQPLSDMNIIRSLKNNNLSLSELSIAGETLARPVANSDLKYAVFHAAPCDRNILGFISDLALEVSGIDLCVVYTEEPNEYRLSVRSCARTVMANEFTEFITQGVGGGGGHIYKAAGGISKSKVNSNIDGFIQNRITDYFQTYDLIDSASHNLNVESSGFKSYVKKKIPLGFAKTADVFGEGMPLVIRTLEGDTETQSGDDVYIMIGLLGEAYPIKAEKWAKSYDETGEAFDASFHEYAPKAIDKTTGEAVEITTFAKSCVARGDVYIFAKPLDKHTKVFTAWQSEGYMSGKPGDFIAVRSDDCNDVYVIREDIFFKTYTEI